MSEGLKVVDGRQAVHDAVVRRLEEMARDEAGGGLTPTRVVLEAERLGDESPFSQYLTWDNDKAAHKCRLIEAANLIRKVRVVVETSEGRRITFRKFSSSLPDRISGGGYRLTQEVLNDDERRGALLDTALAEFNALRRKYKSLEELSGVFDAIDEVLE